MLLDIVLSSWIWFLSLPWYIWAVAAVLCLFFQRLAEWSKDEQDMKAEDASPVLVFFGVLTVLSGIFTWIFGLITAIGVIHGLMTINRWLPPWCPPLWLQTLPRYVWIIVGILFFISWSVYTSVDEEVIDVKSPFDGPILALTRALTWILGLITFVGMIAGVVALFCYLL
jgi:hypothetical protein